jgi:plasmid stability protein
MGSLVQIRNVPDDARAALKARAARRAGAARESAADPLAAERAARADELAPPA